MMRVWKADLQKSWKAGLYLLALSVLGAFASVGCSSKPDPILQCRGQAGTNPTTVFPNKTVVLGGASGSYELFKGGKEYGCLGITWEGQTNPVTYIAEVKSDGTYLLQDPSSKQFVADGVRTNIAAGVAKIDVWLYLLKRDPAQLDCKAVVQSGLQGCLQVGGDCLFAWRSVGVPASAEGTGTCRLCSRELCNGKDDNCDAKGEVDEGKACGSVLGQGCRFVPEVKPDTAGCTAAAACECLRDSQGAIYVCAAPADPNDGQKPDAAQLKWTIVEEAAKLCTQGGPVKTYFCAKSELVCDTCGGKAVFRPRTEACAKQIFLEYTP